MQRLCICDGDLHLHTRLDADGGDLLDDLRWTVQIDQTLVDPHLKAIPGFGSFTAGGFSGGDAQSLHRLETSDFSQNQTPTNIIHEVFRIQQIEFLSSAKMPTVEFTRWQIFLHCCWDIRQQSTSLKPPRLKSIKVLLLWWIRGMLNYNPRMFKP